MSDEFQNGLVVGIYVALFFAILFKLVKRVDKLEKAVAAQE